MLGFRIGHGEEIAVRIIRECRIPIDRIGQLGDTIQGIRRVEGLLPKRVGDVSETPGCVQNPLHLAIERFFDLDQIADLIGERGEVVEGILDRERQNRGQTVISLS